MAGGGKSFLIEDLIKKNLNAYIIFDVKCDGDYDKLGAHKVSSYEQLYKALVNKKTKILFESEKLTAGLLNRCLELIYKCLKNIIVIIEEAHLFVSKHKCPKWLKQFLKVGRSKGKGAWLVSQRGQDLHNDIITQTTHKICGKVSSDDEEYMEKKMALKKHGHKIDDLKQYEFWYLKFVAGETPVKLKV
jgi:hypothetical protein